MADYFKCQANAKVFYVGLYIMAESRPIVFLSQKLTSFLDTKMANQKIFVVMAN